MKTVSYKSLRDGVIRRMGLDASLTPLDSQSAAIAEYLQSALEAGWDFYPWPDITLTEQRTPTGTPATTISATQPGETVIGEFLQILSENPDDDTVIPMSYDFHATGTEAVIDTAKYSAGEPVWVRFRIPIPQFSSTEYSASTAYAPGDVVYHPASGDCYLCTAASTGNAPTNASFWRRQQVPDYLGEYAKLYALAETLQEDGQYDKAAYQFTRSRGILEDRQDDFWMKRDRYHHYTARFAH